jgi:hypothetical protein
MPSVILRSSKTDARALRISASAMEDVIEQAADRKDVSSVSLNGIPGVRSINKYAIAG